MNKHDQKRKQDLVRTLCKAKEQADLCRLYLSNRDVSLNADELVGITGALGHIEASLEQLGAICQDIQ